MGEKSIKSQSKQRFPSKSFDANYDTTFPEHKMVRGKWIFNPKTQQLEEYGAAVEAGANIGLQINTDSHYEGLRTTDGVPVNSRRKHRQYMKDNDLALVGDYKESWKRAEKIRNDPATGRAERIKDVREAVDRLARGSVRPPDHGSSIIPD